MPSAKIAILGPDKKLAASQVPAPVLGSAENPIKDFNAPRPALPIVYWQGDNPLDPINAFPGDIVMPLTTASLPMTESHYDELAAAIAQMNNAMIEQSARIDSLDTTAGTQAGRLDTIEQDISTLKTYQTTTLAAPTGFIGTPTQDPSVSLTWNAVTSATGYKIYRNNTLIYTSPVSANAPATSYVDTAVAYSTTYTYQISTLNINNAEGPKSAVVSVSVAAAPTVVTLSPPTNITATPADTPSVTLNWTAVSGATKYHIYRGTSANNTVGIFTTFGSPAPTTYTDSTNLSNSTTYFYQIATIDANGEGVKSAAVSAVIPAAPTGGGGTTPPPTTPTGTLAQSYWASTYPISDARGLNVLGAVALPADFISNASRKRAGTRPTAVASRTSSTTMTYSGGTVQNKDFVGGVVGTGTTFINCTFTSTGFKLAQQYGTGSTPKVVDTTNCIFIDCEFYGGSGACATGSGDFYRCYFTEGDDCINTRVNNGAGIRLFECVIDGAKRENSTSHSDAVQSSTNAGSTTVHLYSATRSWISCYNPKLGDHQNSCIQLGGYGSASSGITGTMTDCVFMGGNTTINYDSPGGSGITYRGCFISRRWRGLNSKGDEGGPGFSSVTTDTRIKDSSNRWLENPTVPIITTMLSRLDA